MASTVTASGPCSTARLSAARAMAIRVPAFLRSRSPAVVVTEPVCQELAETATLQDTQYSSGIRPRRGTRLVHYLAVHWDQPELPFPAVTMATCRYATFSECPMCGATLLPEHAHFRCGTCG